MPRTAFGESQQHAEDGVRLLASRVEKAIVDSMEALRTRNMTLARAVVDGDTDVNQKRYALEEEVLQMMATQAPVASDLRESVSILSIVADLERIGDHAEGIARIALFLGDQPLASTEPDLWVMAEKAREMLRGSIDSFLERDEAAARAICDLDDEVDQIYDRIHRHVIEQLSGLPLDAQEFDSYTHLLWASHNIERMGDRATNICERAIFLVTGRFEEINVSSY
ncbi:MAG: phosphate transport system protein [Chloroflexi bacterium]|jgi:phosphate transport system protein|nr:MAG: phosphate transport system protein [Chloroflexota bacterium]